MSYPIPDEREYHYIEVCRKFRSVGEIARVLIEPRDTAWREVHRLVRKGWLAKHTDPEGTNRYSVTDEGALAQQRFIDSLPPESDD